ncbi:MAG: HEAT repeat domain-containing protein, partial [Planctomycetota bacterium]
MTRLLEKGRRQPPRRLKTRFYSAGGPKAGGSISVFRLRAVFLMSTLMLSFGCNDSVQPVADWPDNAYTGDLVTEATRIVRDGLIDSDPLIRVHAIEVVATTRQIRMMPAVQQMLSDRFSSVRFAASLAVGDLQYSIAKTQVAPLLNDPDPNVRIAAAYAMTRLGSPTSYDIIQKAIASSDQTLRANAALLLGKTGDKSALKLLWWALGREDSDFKVRFQAAESIAMLGDERVFPKVWATVLSAYADDRIMGIRAMGALGTPKAREVLVTKLDDDVPEVRLAAAAQLGMLGDPTGEPEVLDVFRKNLTAGFKKERLEHVSVLTALAIGRIG